ncbi:putative addiction module antidote protein [Candidatus Poribacteria bacterium]|nr:putative addiction module antidote protein [Candidatus Poribacteria bacterium]
MNKETILKNTTSYEDGLIEDLKDPKEAQAYLEASFLAYEEDGNTDALLLALGHVAKAQGGIGQLSKRTAVSCEQLYDMLASKHQPRLDTVLSILSALGFRFRLERQTLPIESSPLQEKTPA